MRYHNEKINLKHQVYKGVFSSLLSLVLQNVPGVEMDWGSRKGCWPIMVVRSSDAVAPLAHSHEDIGLQLMLTL